MDTVDHLRHIARDPIGHHGLYTRTPEALQTFEARNSRTMADEYRAAWRSQIAFGAPLVGLALFAVFVFAADPIGRLAEWRWNVDHAEEMK